MTRRQADTALSGIAAGTEYDIINLQLPGYRDVVFRPLNDPSFNDNSFQSNS